MHVANLFIFAPSGFGGWLEVFWLPVIFGFFIFVPVQHLFVVLVGSFLVRYWAFHGLFLLKHFCGEFDPGSG